MQIERGPGRGLSHAHPGPGWAGKRPPNDGFRTYPPPPRKTKTSSDCVGVARFLAQPCACTQHFVIAVPGRVLGRPGLIFDQFWSRTVAPMQSPGILFRLSMTRVETSAALMRVTRKRQAAQPEHKRRLRITIGPSDRMSDAVDQAARIPDETNQSS